jgi:hypothetical protein
MSWLEAQSFQGTLTGRFSICFVISVPSPQTIFGRDQPRRCRGPKAANLLPRERYFSSSWQPPSPQYVHVMRTDSDDFQLNLGQGDANLACSPAGFGPATGGLEAPGEVGGVAETTVGTIANPSVVRLDQTAVLLHYFDSASVVSGMAPLRFV